MVVLGYFLQCIIGCWIFVLVFRRPVMSVLSEVFYEGSGLDDTEIFKLSSRAKQELVLLVLLCPCVVADLRAVPLTNRCVTFCCRSMRSPFARAISAGTP